MSEQSNNLSLPFLQPSQAQKHVTHNEALRILDSLVQLSVRSMTAASPPAAPEPGQRHILPAAPSGLWSARAGGDVAIWDGTAWTFEAPRTGWLAYVEDKDRLVLFDGSDWNAAAALPEQLARFGINTTPDDTNRLAVASDATLLTHAGAGHQLKLNKNAPGDTASLLFQSAWSGRAEMGLPGGDDFEVKVSANGSDFHTALRADAATGEVSFPAGVRGVAPDDFGTGPVATTAYVNARGLDLITNGTGALGNGYNFPPQMSFDPTITPNLPGSFRFDGYFQGAISMHEALVIDPNQTYRLGCYFRQASVAGDWSAYTHGERHRQYMGLLFSDVDGNSILSYHHMRHREGGVDSLTTLAAPLSPGDTVVSVTDASGWNASSSAGYARGILLLGYRNSRGYLYDYYSRIFAFDLFDLGQVDKVANTISLKVPLPASMGNPDDPSGTWPVGTRLANSTAGATWKYCFFHQLHAPETDTWFRTEDHIGGIDRSGTNEIRNFPPGTTFAKPFWRPNNDNYVGGHSGYPDTGPDHSVWFTGVSVQADLLARQKLVTSGPRSGARDIKVAQIDFDTGAMSYVAPSTQVTPV